MIGAYFTSTIGLLKFEDALPFVEKGGKQRLLYYDARIPFCRLNTHVMFMSSVFSLYLMSVAIKVITLH